MSWVRVPSAAPISLPYKESETTGECLGRSLRLPGWHGRSPPPWAEVLLLALVGAVIGLLVGRLLGKYMPNQRVVQLIGRSGSSELNPKDALQAFLDLGTAEHVAGEFHLGLSICRRTRPVRALRSDEPKGLDVIRRTAAVSSAETIVKIARPSYSCSNSRTAVETLMQNGHVVSDQVVANLRAGRQPSTISSETGIGWTASSATWP